LIEWDPATEAEAMMREALASSDQEHYFRILARSELLLPVSMDALAGRAPMGWGTWTTASRTHVLAFTSPQSLYACLNEPGASYRSVPFHVLSTDWPNYEWWLAVNPGLPIEAYLPSWFVSQLTRGEVRLPGRTMGARARMAQSDLAAALAGRNRASVPTTAATAPPVTTPPRPIPRPIPRPMDRREERRDDRREERRDDRREERRGPPPERYGERLGERLAASAANAAPPPPPPAAPTKAKASAPTTASAPIKASARPPVGEVETVDAEIVDYPAASGSARVYATEATVVSDTYEPPYGRGPGAGVTFSARVDAHTSEGYEPEAGFGPRSTPRYGTAASNGGDTVRIMPAGPRPASAEEPQDAEVVSSPPSRAAGFVPANETEVNLLAAAEENNTDAFLSTLLLARIMLPVPHGTPSGASPRDLDFPWQVDRADGQRFVSVYTSPERFAEHAVGRFGTGVSSVSLRFVQLIGAWPDEEISFAINPGTAVGATLPGSQIVALAAWANDVGLRDEPSAEVALVPKVEPTSVAGAPAVGATQATMMQRTVPPSQLPFYLERGYDRVSGFVNRASEVKHLTSPRALYRALGLLYSGSPFTDDDAEVHVVRWVAHRSDLYRLPYGGQHEAAMRAMQGWVVERAPFRGNGFAPGDTDVVAEFKVDSVRLPHGAQMWRLAKDATETLVATFDADTTRWVPAPLGGRHA
jgi:SseB protein N-terminal domain